MKTPVYLCRGLVVPCHKTECFGRELLHASGFRPARPSGNALRRIRGAEAVGPADRREPLKDYARDLLLAGECKGIEPMAARRLQHEPIAHALSSDAAVLAEVRR